MIKKFKESSGFGVFFVLFLKSIPKNIDFKLILCGLRIESKKFMIFPFSNVYITLLNHVTSTI